MFAENFGTRGVEFGSAVEDGEQRNQESVASHMWTSGLCLPQAPPEGGNRSRRMSRCCHENIYTIHPNLSGKKLMVAPQGVILALFVS